MGIREFVRHSVDPGGAYAAGAAVQQVDINNISLTPPRRVCC